MKTITQALESKRLSWLCFLTAMMFSLPVWPATTTAYLVTSADGSQVTFYYDAKMSSRTGTVTNIADFDGFDATKAAKVKKVTFDSSFASARPTSTARWFSSMSNLTAIEGITNLNTSKVTTMRSMFYGCSKLTDLDLSKFDTSNVETMYCMFYNCSNLNYLDLSSFNTPKLTTTEHLFSKCANLNLLDISNFDTSNVTNMEAMFSECVSLTHVDVSSFNTAKVTNMRHTFNECTSLQEAILPDSVTTVEQMAFASCSSLEIVHLPANLTTLGYMAFNSCTSLKCITIPESLTTIGAATFPRCTSLEQVIFSDGIEIIQPYAFTDCASLTGIVFPSSLKTIGSSAFSGCSSLTEITIPASVTTIEDSAFAGCTNLSEIKVDPENSNYGTVSGALFNKAMTELIGVPSGYRGAFMIPYGVTTVHSGAFYKCAIDAVVIPKTVNNIRTHAFFECNSLQDVFYLGNSTNWQSVTIASSNTSLTDATMHYPQYSGTCGTSATWSFFNDGLMVISGTGAMTNYSSSSSTPWSSYLYNIKAIIVDYGITHIGNNAFRSSSVESLTIQDASLSMGNYCFAYNTHLTDIDFGTGTIIPASCVFEDCTALESVHIPANVVMNGSYSEDGSGYDMFHSCIYDYVRRKIPHNNREKK